MLCSYVLSESKSTILFRIYELAYYCCWMLTAFKLYRIYRYWWLSFKHQRCNAWICCMLYPVCKKPAYEIKAFRRIKKLYSSLDFMTSFSSTPNKSKASSKVIFFFPTCIFLRQPHRTIVYPSFFMCFLRSYFTIFFLLLF